MIIVIRENRKDECYDLIDSLSDQSHDGDNASEVIASVYEKHWAEKIANLLEEHIED